MESPSSFTLFVLLIIIAVFSDSVSSWEYRIGSCVLIGGRGDCPDTKNIKIFLYTKSNPTEPQYIHISETFDNISTSNFNSSLENKLIIHGYNSDMFLDALVDIKAVYVANHDYNVWTVDWSALCKCPCYPFAVYNIRHTGKCIAQFIERLQQYVKSPLQMHVVAFSLGAHVANYVANSLANYKLSRITGLDPAMPGFTTRNRRRKLDASDADFVDVVHTNALVQGKLERCGHVDFYMNGGSSQPGCLREHNPFACDHHRAPQYFAESINTTIGFLGWRCRGYKDYIFGLCMPKNQFVLMGEYCPTSSRGFYLVYTADEQPFALGMWAGEHYSAPKTFYNQTTEFDINNITDFTENLEYT